MRERKRMKNAPHSTMYTPNWLCGYKYSCIHVCVCMYTCMYMYMYMCTNHACVSQIVHYTCSQVFTETLQNKKADVERIEDLADLLRTEDGEKKNGTSDVESR